MRSLRLDVLYVTGVVGSRSVAYEGDKTPPLCLGSRQQAALGGRLPLALTRAGARRCVWARGRPPWPQASVAAALARLTRCIGGVMHHCKPWDVEDVASFTTHQRSVSESSPVQSSGRCSLCIRTAIGGF